MFMPVTAGAARQHDGHGQAHHRAATGSPGSLAEAAPGERGTGGRDGGRRAAVSAQGMQNGC